MQQLKNAFLKAGLVTKEEADRKTSKPPKRLDPVKKSKVPKKELNKFHEHHVKSECELCNNVTPDVEYYKHNNRLIVKRWLCTKCADDNMIDDELRDTNQSFNSKSGSFRRMWGKTKTFRNIPAKK